MSVIVSKELKPEASRAPQTDAKPERGHPIIAGVLLLVAILVPMWAVHHPGTGWNVNTRLALVYAVVEQGTFSINAFHDTPELETMDKALFEGNYYSDKIFGVSLLAIPVYWAARKLAGDTPDFVRREADYLLKNWAVALPGALSALFFWILLIKIGTPPRRAILLTGVSVLGTMWYGYSTVFYPYAPGLAASLAALLITFFPPARRLTSLNSLAIGLLLGYTLLCDLIFGLLVFGLGVVWLLRLLDQHGLYGSRAFAEMTGERSQLRHVILYSVCFWIGVLIPLSLFFAYCYSIFGELTLPYRFEASDRFREGMSHGIMGVTAPKPHVLWFITVHPFRGILFWSPIVAAGLLGCILGTRQYGKRRILGWLGIYTFVAYLLFNGGYYMWWGGWSMGPRFMIPMLPFVLLGLGELARTDKLSAFARSPRWALPAWSFALLTGIVSVALSFPVALYDPQVPQGNQDYVLDTADISTRLAVPQLEVLKAVYTGRAPVQGLSFMPKSSALSPPAQWDHRRVHGMLAVIIVLLAGAFAAAPAAIPGIHRRDYPFHTVDGSAAPPLG